MFFFNSVGVYEFFVFCIIIEVIIDIIYGFGEFYGDDVYFVWLQKVVVKFKGFSVFEINYIFKVCVDFLVDDMVIGGDGMVGMVMIVLVVDKVFLLFEVVCLDIQGKLVGVFVSDFFGGRV